LSSVTCGPEWEVSRPEHREFPVVTRRLESLFPAIWGDSTEVPGCLYLHRSRG
jgi:hypothetical protein